jgi:hypothetical protein
MLWSQHDIQSARRLGKPLTVTIDKAYGAGQASQWAFLRVAEGVD